MLKLSESKAPYGGAEQIITQRWNGTTKVLLHSGSFWFWAYMRNHLISQIRAKGKRGGRCLLGLNEFPIPEPKFKVSEI